MQTTQLFVELLVIGVGVLLWLGLLIAAIFGYEPNTFPDLNSGEVALLTGFLVAAGYALGILVDRVSREICQLLFGPRAAQAAHESRLENLIKTSSETLGKEIEYNRSRLRICRSWAFNLLLASIAFAIWNSRVAALASTKSLMVSAVGFTLSLGMFLVSGTLIRDHSKNLQKSSDFIESQNSRELK